MIEIVAQISWCHLYYTAYLYFLNYKLKSLAHFNVYTVIYHIGFLLYAIYDPNLTRKANTGERKQGFYKYLVRLFILMEIVFFQENQLKIYDHSFKSFFKFPFIFIGSFNPLVFINNVFNQSPKTNQSSNQWNDPLYKHVKTK